MQLAVPFHQMHLFQPCRLRQAAHKDVECDFAVAVSIVLLAYRIGDRLLVLCPLIRNLRAERILRWRQVILEPWMGTMASQSGIVQYFGRGAEAVSFKAQEVSANSKWPESITSNAFESTSYTGKFTISA